MNKPTKTIAIVGCGPRGLSALENLVLSFSKTNNQTVLQILLFEKAKQLGCGTTYHLEQPDTNWLNISERALTIAKRPKIIIDNIEIDAFPSYHEWTGKSKFNILNNDHEVFPKRSEIGKYLNQRFNSIASILEENDFLKIVNAEVKIVDTTDKTFTIQLKNEVSYNADEVVLTIGHQDTQLSKQLKEWINYTENNAKVKLFLECYPIQNVLTVDFKDKAHTVGLRGFGLATIDLIRAITEANGGSFEVIDTKTNKMKYTSGKTNLKLVPFSLDGLSMASKPLNSKIDALFTPSEAKLLAFKSHLVQVKDNANYSNGNAFLVDAMAEIAANQFMTLGSHAYPHNYSTKELKEIISAYLNDDGFSHDLILSHKNAPEVIIQSFVDMATASKPISLDYCLGQVWRHCEPTLYKMMSHSALSDKVISDVIALDERMKRYAFGPPIESLQQLLAVIYQGTLDVNFLNDPEIKLTDKGWQLEKDEQQITADIMINAVLDSPEIVKVTAPIVTNLLEDKLIQPIHSNLGVETITNGLVVSKDKKHTHNLAFLGRLAKGSVVGVDAILECFGPRIKDWADGVVERL